MSTTSNRTPLMETSFIPTARDVFPELPEKDLREAEACLEQYLTLVLRIFERTELERSRSGRLTADNGTLACTRPGSQSST